MPSRELAIFPGHRSSTPGQNRAMTISGSFLRKLHGTRRCSKSESRRDFLRFAAATMSAATVAAAAPRILRPALEVPRSKRTGTINDVEHIVILTQENRSFDHYFGAL